MTCPLCEACETDPGAPRGLCRWCWWQASHDPSAYREVHGVEDAFHMAAVLGKQAKSAALDDLVSAYHEGCVAEAAERMDRIGASLRRLAGEDE